MLRRFTAALAFAVAVPSQQTPSLTTFRNYNQTFQIELPTGWRQLAPNEARRIGEDPRSPVELRLAQPTRFYAVGPVDRWLAGDYSGPLLFVHEQAEQWHVDSDYAATLRASWRSHGEANDVRHELADIHRERVGTQQVESILALRTSTPRPPAPARRSLDVHAPTARQQITLAFTCSPDAFDRWHPEFRAWLKTVTFARIAPEPATLADRLWTPVVTGAVVGVVLLLLYRHTRSRR
ncbi:MAG TPA: hypothetical protein ENI87_05975 [bacterium]|nr:hypothetical protein [bacterium]